MNFSYNNEWVEQFLFVHTLLISWVNFGLSPGG